MLGAMGHGVEGHATAASDLDARTAKSVATTMQALSTPSRLMILGRLRRGPATVGELSEDVAMEQSAVSHQLRLLRNLGLVEGERRGRSIVYALYDDHVAALLDQAVFHSEHLRLGAVDRPTESSPAAGSPG
jgi:ArsR family transcriptional regulator, nickel/cobalt-responsive transcriptional repressor